MWPQPRLPCHCRHRRSDGRAVRRNSAAYSAKSISPPRHLLKSLDQPLALQPGQPLDPEQAIQLIDLMLVTNRAQAVGFFGLRMAVDVAIVDPDVRMTPGIETLPSRCMIISGEDQMISGLT
jgi:hypothetical protein